MKLYQHFKGDLYVVTNDEVIDCPTGDKLVSYTRVTDGASYVRLFSQFHENVEHKGKTGPRFRVITDPADIMPKGGHP
jgi:hypothetical protein